MSHALLPILETAVMMRIMEIRRMGYIPDYLYKEAQETGDLIANCGDRLLFRSPKQGETAGIFNKVAKAIAILAFQPGGVEVFGFKFEASLPSPPMINLSHTNESLTYDETVALDKALDCLANNPQRGLNANSQSAHQKLKAEIKKYEQSILVVEEL